MKVEFAVLEALEQTSAEKIEQVHGANYGVYVARKVWAELTRQGVTAPWSREPRLDDVDQLIDGCESYALSNHDVSTAAARMFTGLTHAQLFGPVSLSE